MSRPVVRIDSNSNGLRPLECRALDAVKRTEAEADEPEIRRFLGRRSLRGLVLGTLGILRTTVDPLARGTAGRRNDSTQAKWRELWDGFLTPILGKIESASKIRCNPSASSSLTQDTTCSREWRSNKMPVFCFRFWEVNVDAALHSCSPCYRQSPCWSLRTLTANRPVRGLWLQ